MDAQEMSGLLRLLGIIASGIGVYMAFGGWVCLAVVGALLAITP